MGQRPRGLRQLEKGGILSQMSDATRKTALAGMLSVT